MPVVVGRLKWLARKHPGYAQNIAQRFGRVQPRHDSPLWIHAVSVGETIAAEPLVRLIQKAHPDWPILITNTTPTGAEQSERLFGDSVSHQYAPYDVPGTVERFLDRINPRALVIMETELWPNWVAELSKRGVPSILANARMSEKSAARYARAGSMISEMMSSLSFIAAQYQNDAQRFKELGASENAVSVLGNIKADIQITEDDRRVAEAAKSDLETPRAPVIIAASTHPGEDEIILDAFQRIQGTLPEALLYLVPRHAVRAAEVEALITDRNLQFVRRSDQSTNERIKMESDHAIVLGDQMGELRALFGAADIVLMGGTLVDHGGHNPLEPAAWGLPILAGPSQRNFDSLFNEMEAKGALGRTDNASSAVANTLVSLWQDSSKRAAMSIAAADYLESQRGAATRVLEAIESLIA